MTGLGPTLARDIPFSAVYYVVYTQLKQLQPEVHEFIIFIDFFPINLINSLSILIRRR